MSIAHLISKIAIAIVIGFVGFGTTVAQEAPGKPIEFGARVVENGTMVSLTWMENREGGDPTSFCIYYAEGETEKMEDFDLLAETDSPANPNGVYSYLVKDLEPGTYTFYVVAKNEDGESPRSIIKVVELKEESNEPGKPVEFSAKVIANGNAVELRWQKNREGGEPTKFCIFYAEGETEKMDDFELLDEVEAEPNTAVYEYVNDDLEAGVYSFYVIAKNEDGESKRSFIKVVRLGEREPEVAIISKRVSDGKAGKAWDHQVKIEMNFESDDITYKIKDAPEGVEIDAETGKITWEDPVEGRHVFVICVEVEHEGQLITAEQEFVLEIGDDEGNGNGEKCAAFVGSVSFGDPAGRPVMEGEVTAWMIKEAGNSGKNLKRTHSVRIIQGRYGIELPAGTYKLAAEGEGFYAEWYENADNADDATEVVLECDQEKEINFVVEARPEPTMHTVSGQVYDAVNDAPIFNALVKFEFVGEPSDKPRGNLKRIITETDRDGNYSVMLPSGIPYISYAVVREPNANKNRYLVEWWDNSHDATTANEIILDGDREGIDFPMDVKEEAEGGFSGTMMDDESEEGVVGRVVAYQIKAVGKEEEGKRKIESVETDNNGDYRFTNLSPGEYIVLGIPAERPYVPGWYVMDDIAAHSWKDASRISVDDAMVALQHDIRLERVTDGVGRGEARGWVFDKRTGHIKSDNGVVQETEGIHGAIVYALDDQMNVVDYAVASEDGEYGLFNLGIGETMIMADRIDFEPDAETIILSDEELSGAVSIGLLPIVTSVEIPTDKVGLGRAYNLYPNPTSDVATISFPSTTGTAMIRVVHSNGIVLSTMSVETNHGTTSVELNLNDVAPGMVMVHVVNGDASFALPLSIVR